MRKAKRKPPRITRLRHSGNWSPARVWARSAACCIAIGCRHRCGTRRRPQYWFDSRRRYFVKHFGVLGLLLADMLWLLGKSSLGLRRALRLGSGGTMKDPKGFALDLVRGDLRALLTGAVWRIGREP